MANDTNWFSDAFSLADGAELGAIEFQPSTIETIDRALFDYFDEQCNFHVNSNKGWRKVPVIWVGAERAFQVKERKEMRDSGGMLKLPMMAIERLSITKDPTRKGLMPANIRDNPDAQGGSITIARRIKQDKTSHNRTSAQKRKWSGDEYTSDTRPTMSDRFKATRQDGKVVYQTVTIPMPSRILVEYKISVQTDFHTQMNEILQAVHSKVKNHKEFFVEHDGHRFTAFLDDFAFNNNLATLEEEDRVLRTEMTVKIEGYLIGGGPNDAKPKFAKRENAVHIAIPREGIVIDGGLVIPEKFARLSSDRAVQEVKRILTESAVRGQVRVSMDGSSGGGVSATAVIHHSDFVIQQALTGDLDGSNTTFSLQAGARTGTLTLILNGLILAEGNSNDYAISGTTVTMAFAPDDNDRLVASYVKS
jgi:hypothetical protein